MDVERPSMVVQSKYRLVVVNSALGVYISAAGRQSAHDSRTTLGVRSLLMIVAAVDDAVTQ